MRHKKLKKTLWMSFFYSNFTFEIFRYLRMCTKYSQYFKYEEQPIV